MIETTGAKGLIELAYQVTAKKGRCILVGVPHDLAFGHARIMLERQRCQRGAMVAAAADAGEADDGADIGAARGQRGDFLRDIEIGLLNANGRSDRLA